MASALEGFLKLECDTDLAGRLRAEVVTAQGEGYDRFEFNLFDVELFYTEGRVTVAQVVPLGYDDVALRLTEFLDALPDAPPGPRMAGRARSAIIPPPPPSH